MDACITNHEYQVKTETESIGDANYSIRGLVDRQQFSDPNDQALNLGISSSQWPHFGQVWPMSRVLARVMLKESLQQRRILEIGCGLALPSIVVKTLGGDITACDYHPLAESFLIENARLNRLTEINYGTGNWDLGNSELGKFDLIIGSDLLYEPHHADLLSLFIDAHTNKGAEVIIVDPGRGSHRVFAKAMQRLGYTHTWSNIAEFSEQDSTQKGFVLRFTQSTP